MSKWNSGEEVLQSTNYLLFHIDSQSIPPPDANDAMLQNFLHEESKDEAPPPYHPSFSPPFSYNIPPSSSNVNLPPDPSKKINTASGNVSFL